MMVVPTESKEKKCKMSIEKEEKVNKEEMSEREKELDNEIREIYEKCMNAGHIETISRISAPLLSGLLHVEEAAAAKRTNSWRKRRRWYSWILLIFVVIVGLLRVDWTPIVLSTYGRNVLIQMLPYWDWTQLYYQNCFIRNPYYVHRKLQEDDCQICEAFENICRISNASHTDISEDYLKSDVPVIVQDAIRDWNVADGTFSVQNISKILLEADTSGEVYPCTFASNLRLRGDNYFRTFLHKLRSEDVNSKRWYAHWENCDKMSSKALRRCYPRPYFLPPMVDTMEPNWVFLSSNYRGRIFKEVPLLSDMLWVSQLTGSIQVRLLPRHPCNETCLQIENTLNEGETLVFTDRMWRFQYFPNDGGINVAIGGGGSFEL